MSKQQRYDTIIMLLCNGHTIHSKAPDDALVKYWKTSHHSLSNQTNRYAWRISLNKEDINVLIYSWFKNCLITFKYVSLEYKFSSVQIWNTIGKKRHLNLTSILILKFKEFDRWDFQIIKQFYHLDKKSIGQTMIVLFYFIDNIFRILASIFSLKANK